MQFHFSKTTVCKRFFLLALVLVVSSCASTSKTADLKKQFQDSIKAGKCEQAQASIPLEKDATKALRYLKSVQGGIISVVSFSGALVADTALLGLLFYTCAHGGCHGPGMHKMLFPVSQYVYRRSGKLWCPDNSYYVNKLLEVAECYRGRKDKVSQEASTEIVSDLHKSSQASFSCITALSQQKIEAFMARDSKK